MKFTFVLFLVLFLFFAFASGQEENAGVDHLREKRQQSKKKLRESSNAMKGHVENLKQMHDQLREKGTMHLEAMKGMHDHVKDRLKSFDAYDTAKALPNSLKARMEAHGLDFGPDKVPAPSVDDIEH
ncbi:unnamed protein product [Heterosigma akashiwo]|uniref:Uncharacterized protein n=1 Tax=Heterosigma akashiwo TaxID=2829 RepID=A0A6V1KCS5_HETAK|mmetsp:Transcript_29862/g.51859  ORF Transcript_29862/g.51859 Transcript_29862/m.51859 type:complete len:127 (+) Transcript_29862:81-461(+)